MAVRWVLGAGLALLLALVAFTLAQSAPRAAGSNYVPEVAEVVKLDGDGRHCQDGETIPGDAAALRLLVGTYGAPAPQIDVTVRERGGSLLTSGRLPRGAREGHLIVPIDEVADTTSGARVCLAIATTASDCALWRRRSGPPRMAAGRQTSRGSPCSPPSCTAAPLAEPTCWEACWLLVAMVLVLAATAATARVVLREVGERP